MPHKSPSKPPVCEVAYHLRLFQIPLTHKPQTVTINVFSQPKLAFTPINEQTRTQLWQIPSDNTPATGNTSRLVKQLTPPFTIQQYQSFCREIDVLNTCQSLAIIPNTCHHHNLTGVTQLIESDIDARTPYFVMPLYQGTTLDKICPLSSEHRITQRDEFRQRLLYAVQLCDIVEKIHCLGYLHSDIKLSNILITDTALLLLDFGLAKALTKLDNSTSQDFTAGTPAYMSPEQFTGQPLSAQSDYYSIGVVIYALLCGRLPFMAHTLHGWAMAHCQQPPPLLPSFSKFDITSSQQQQLQRLMDELLAKYPANRCASLSEVTQCLSSLVC